jgi:hypothetical protein
VHAVLILFGLLTLFIVVDEWLGCDQNPGADVRKDTL